jgi:hypothetical protein
MANVVGIKNLICPERSRYQSEYFFGKDMMIIKKIRGKEDVLLLDDLILTLLSSVILDFSSIPVLE